MARSKYEVDPHWHCCTRCRQRYEDTCIEGGVNKLCSHCVTGKGWALLRKNREPRDCCVAHSRVVADKKELDRLSLKGSGEWYICRACGRSQGYNPAIKIYRHEESA